MINANGGSFRDPSSRVYTVRSEKNSSFAVYRGVDSETLENFKKLEDEPFFKQLLDEKRVVKTKLCGPNDKVAKTIAGDGWAGVLEHEPVSLISYSYEWPFAMLKRAALLHLRILTDALEAQWTVKDSTPFNIQFEGTSPIFIDIPSFVPWEEGEPWTAYRQFCCCFLTPLMMRSYLGVDHLPLSRSYLDGIPPIEAAKFFRGFSRFKRGVASHILLPARVEKRIESRERDSVPAKDRKQQKVSRQFVLALVESVTRLVKSLSVDIKHTDWSEYDKTHTYNDEEFQEKKSFVEEFVRAKKPSCVMDIGCNTGTFSKIAAQYADLVIAADGDHDAIQKLFLHESKHSTHNNIAPLVINLSNVSPNQGWSGNERSSFDSRVKPNGILVLALVHHIRISANIPMALFLDWLQSFDCDVVIEFVDRHDEMVIKLLQNKAEQYLDYSRDAFERDVKERFKLANSRELKGGKRIIYHIEPK